MLGDCSYARIREQGALEVELHISRKVDVAPSSAKNRNGVLCNVGKAGVCVDLDWNSLWLQDLLLAKLGLHERED